MGQDLTLTSNGTTFEYRISRTDWQLIQVLREHLPAEVDNLFTVAALGEEVRVPTEAMRVSVDRVLAFVLTNKHLLPYTYQYKVERSGDPNIIYPGFNTGGRSGIRLPGDDENTYWIRVGLNECRLRKMPLDRSGSSSWEDARDLRGERQLATANLGMITIRRSRAKTDLVKALSGIQEFLKRATNTEVVKAIS